MNNHRHLKRTIGAAVLLAASFLLISCNSVENESQSASLLIVEGLTGLDMQGTEGFFLQSDVLIEDPATGASSVRADSAKATFRATTLEPDPLLGTSQYNDIQITRYVVTYIRADGRNREGVDVPYSFEGSLSALIRIGISTSVSFVIVREVAKQEPPLFNLRAALPGDILNVTAKVDFYGHDLANKAVRATGMLPVFFANYGN
ncbi:MAG: hypothetical protein NTU60_09020 [Candidatus Aminicenantes bacterium]|nr:hypothetical protein [Candidatus Aminicenantes bacterium]